MWFLFHGGIHTKSAKYLLSNNSVEGHMMSGLNFVVCLFLEQ